MKIKANDMCKITKNTFGKCVYYTGAQLSTAVLNPSAAPI
jgi:hypothetical protein